MARLRDSRRTSLSAPQQPRNPQPEAIARSPYQPMFLALWTHSQLLSPQPCGSLVESVCHQLVQAACLVGIEPLRAACPITQAHDEEHGQENRERCGEHQSSLSSSARSPKHKIVSNEVRYITKAHT